MNTATVLLCRDAVCVFGQRNQSDGRQRGPWAGTPAGGRRGWGRGPGWPPLWIGSAPREASIVRCGTGCGGWTLCLDGGRNRVLGGGSQLAAGLDSSTQERGEGEGCPGLDGGNVEHEGNASTCQKCPHMPPAPTAAALGSRTRRGAFGCGRGRRSLRGRPPAPRSTSPAAPPVRPPAPTSPPTETQWGDR